MELRHLRYFAAVAERLNYRAAAEALHVAQPAVSQTILDLEGELGVALLTRNRREVRLTPAGTVFLVEARAILARAASATRLAQRAARGDIGTLVIAFLGSATAPFLPSLIQRYRVRFPHVGIELIEMPPEQQLGAIRRGEVHIGFSRTDASNNTPEIREDVLYDDRLNVVLPAKHPLRAMAPVRLRDLRDENYVLFYREAAPGLFDEAVSLCRTAGFTPRIVGQADLMRTVLTLVASGAGISLLPGCAKHPGEPHVIFRPTTPDSAPIPLCLVWNSAITSASRDAFRALVLASHARIGAKMHRLMAAPHSAEPVAGAAEGR